MATKSLTFDVYGRDRGASSTIRGVRNEAEGAGSAFRRAGPMIAAGLVVAGAAAIKFGADSVQAYAEAEQAQNRLNFAYEKFPNLADVSLESLRALNEEMAKKTRYDDDAFAVAQAQLAQYELTGQQLTDLTPLLADYAGKTGKDLPAAAEDLGKALLGQGRALKDIGIDFEDTGSVAGNFDAIMQGLRGQVGGFAEQDATTAAGKLDILSNKFGEMQEAVGDDLIDPLVNVMDELEKSGAVENMGTALGDVVQGFADLEAKTGWLGDFAEDMAGFSGMIDDIERWGKALGNIGNADERENFATDQIERGGLLGDYLQFARDFGDDWARMWGTAQENTRTGVDGVRGGMGGGLSLMSGDLSVFQSATGEKFGSTWTDANGRTQTGMAGVASATGVGLTDAFGRIVGFSGQVGPQFGTAWAGADGATGTGWNNIVNSTGSGVGRVGAKVGEIPGVVKAPFSGAGSWLASAGESIVEGLIGGIRSMIGAAGRAASDVMSTIAGFIPHSPAKWGPFSGSGWQAVADGGAALREQFMGGFADIDTDIGAGFDVAIEQAMDKSHATVEALVSPSVASRVASQAAQTSTTNIENHFHMQPIRDNDPVTTATIMGREFARRAAG